MAFRSVNTELNVTGNGDFVTILVFIACCMSNDVASAFFDVPPLKMVSFILNGIGHVDGIRLFGRCGICTEGRFLLTERNIILIEVGDLIVLEQHCVVCNRHAICSRRQHTANCSTHVGNTESRGCRRIILICSPATEIHTACQRSGTRIIQNLLHVIACFDVHGHFFSAGLDERHQNSGVSTGLNDSIDREAVRLELDRLLAGVRIFDDHCDHFFGLFVFLDMQHLALAVGTHAGGVHLDADGHGRLDFFAFVDEGDVHGLDLGDLAVHGSFDRVDDLVDLDFGELHLSAFVERAFGSFDGNGNAVDDVSEAHLRHSNNLLGNFFLRKFFAFR